MNIKLILRENLAHTRNEKGITLIALVITIIVLLILAGIAITSLTGDNSILQMATSAKEETQRVSQYEQDKLELMEFLLKEQSGEIEVPTDAVARIGTTYYTTLQSAIDAVPTDNTRTMVVLLKDVNECILVEDNRNIALYLNGNTISPDTTVHDDGVATTINVKNSTIMLADGKVVGVGNYECPNCNEIHEGQAIFNDIGGTIEITDGLEVISDSGAIINLGKLNIMGGKINGKKIAVANSGGSMPDGTKFIGEITISGGYIVSEEYAVFNASGKMLITGGTIQGGEYAIFNYPEFNGIVDISTDSVTINGNTNLDI